MRQYHVIATPHASAITCRAEIHAWLPTEATWRWEPLHEWSIPTTDPAGVRDLYDSVTAHGWTINPEDLPTQLPAIVTVTPRDRTQILTHLAEQIDQIRRYENARDNLLVDLGAGQITGQTISKIIGVSRPQLYILRNRIIESVVSAYHHATGTEREQIYQQLSPTERAKL